MTFRTLFQALLSLAALAFGAAAGLYTAGPSLGVSGLTPVIVRAKPLPLDSTAPAHDRAGRLRFLGALRLEGNHKGFGGISGLLWEPECERLLAVTDTGNWLILAPDERDGRLSGIAAAWLSPILDETGAPPRRKRQADAEALTKDPQTGDVTVWFEGEHRGQRYRGVSACRPESLAAAAVEVLRPEAIRSWPVNGGAEAAVATPDGYLLFSEEAEARPGHHVVARFPDRVASGAPGSYPATEGFVATDAVDAGTAGLLLLTRRFSPERGVAARLLRLTPGPTGFEASTIATLAPPLLVDNMEGLALRQEADRTLLYLASDNNFNPMQRTLLMKVVLEP
jgi:hypothetical protein